MDEKKKILIVDDDESLAKVISEFLEVFGYNALFAIDGESALDTMTRAPVDAVVSDIHMPGMDGFQLMMEVKNRWPGTPVILITGVSAKEAEKVAFSKGADAFIAKPFHLKELKKILDNMLGKQTTNQQSRD